MTCTEAEYATATDQDDIAEMHLRYWETRDPSLREELITRHLDLASSLASCRNRSARLAFRMRASCISSPVIMVVGSTASPGSSVRAPLLSTVVGLSFEIGQLLFDEPQLLPKSAADSVSTMRGRDRSQPLFLTGETRREGLRPTRRTSRPRSTRTSPRLVRTTG